MLGLMSAMLIEVLASDKTGADINESDCCIMSIVPSLSPVSPSIIPRFVLLSTWPASEAFLNQRIVQHTSSNINSKSKSKTSSVFMDTAQGAALASVEKSAPVDHHSHNQNKGKIV